MIRFVCNVLWFLFTGLLTSLSWLILGVLWCVTILGIPFGLQCFKFAKLTLWPFGKKATIRFFAHPIANLIWLLFFGFTLVIGYAICGVCWCVTIVGIPFGVQCFKLAALAAAPFGASVTHS